MDEQRSEIATLKTQRDDSQVRMVIESDKLISLGRNCGLDSDSGGSIVEDSGCISFEIEGSEEDALVVGVSEDELEEEEYEYDGEVDVDAMDDR